MATDDMLISCTSSCATCATLKSPSGYELLGEGCEFCQNKTRKSQKKMNRKRN